MAGDVAKLEDKRLILEMLLHHANPDVAIGNRVASLLPGKGAKVSKKAVRQSLGDLCGKKLFLCPGSPVLAGGGGVVLQCEEADVPGVTYALKVARPSLFTEGDIADAEAAKVEDEYRVHTPLAHSNIAKMIARGTLPWEKGVTTVNLPCVLLEWVEGAIPFDLYLRQAVPGNPLLLVDLLRQTFSALSHLHSSGWIHWDVKGDNLLVSSAGKVKLMDLGNSHRLAQPRHSKYTYDVERESSVVNLPALLRASIQEGEPDVSRNRVPLRLKESSPTWDHPFLDNYMFMREVNRLTDLYPADRLIGEDSAAASPDPVELINRHSSADQVYAARYLQVLARRILSTSAPADKHYYESASEIVVALDRLKPEYGSATGLEELRSVPQRVKRIPPGENVPWTRRVDALMNSAPVRRLKYHRQLATVHNVFSGAEHPRWEHSVGTYAEALRYVRALYCDRSSVLFRLETTEEDVTAVLLAALLHDLGHPAFGHQFEEVGLLPRPLHHEAYVLSVLLSCIDRAPEEALPPQSEKMARADAASLQPILVDLWADGDRTRMESLVLRCIEILRGPDNSSVLRLMPVAHDQVMHQRPLVELSHLAALHSMVSGELDADKADYLRRDGHHCGVEYANGIDRLRLDQSLTVVLTPEAARRGGPLASIGVTDKGVLPLESLIVARYQMFRAVYWNKTVRSLTAMLQYLLESYLLGERPIAVSARNINAGRLDSLLAMFRNLPDREALEWIGGKMTDPVFARIIAGLSGDREQIYWTVAELYGYPEDDSVQRVHPDVGDLYKGLLERWSSGSSRSVIQTVRLRHELRDELVRSINSRLATHTSRRIDGRGAVLLDVPESGKDQVNNLFVARDGGEEPDRLQELTPLAGAVAEAFSRSVRRVRVFLRPDLAEAIAADIGETGLESAVYEALQETIARQLELDLSA